MKGDDIVGALAGRLLAGEKAAGLVLADYLEEHPGETRLGHLKPDVFRSSHDVYRSRRLLRVLCAVAKDHSHGFVRELASLMFNNV